MKRLSLIILLIFFLILSLSGCGPDSNEVDSQVYVIALGCDKAVSNKIRLTIQFPIYMSGGQSGGSSGGGGSGGGSGGGGGGQDTLIETIEAPSILEGINLLNTATTRKISLVHVKAIIFSEAMAREGIESYLSPIARYRETRRIMDVIVCQNTAEDYIRENRTLIGQSTSKAMELSFQLSDTSGYFPKASFQEFYESILSPYSQPFTVYAGLNNLDRLEPLDSTKAQGNTTNAPIETYSVLPGEMARGGNRKLELIGTAIFNGAKMVGTLNSFETRCFLMVTGRFRKGFFTLDDKKSPGEGIPLDLRLGRHPRISVSFKNGVPVIDIFLSIEADVGAIQSRIHYESLDKIEDLNKQIEDVIKKGVISVIKKTQEQYNTDIFGFGRKAAWSFNTIPEFEEYNWIKHYKDAKVNVNVEANVRRTGIMYEAVSARESKQTTKSKGD